MDHVSSPGLLRNRDWDERRLDMQRLLFRQSVCLPNIAIFGGPEESFKLLQQFVDPMYYQRAPAERVEIAIEAASHSRFTNIAMPIKSIVGSNIDLAWAYSYERSNGDTLLHTLAFSLGRVVSNLTRLRKVRNFCSEEWRKRIKARLKGICSMSLITS